MSNIYPCEYCHPDFNGKVKSLDKNNNVYIYPSFGRWRLIVESFDDHVECDIEYCPMCGRNLKFNSGGIK